jgi:hypothetical protein
LSRSPSLRIPIAPLAIGAAFLLYGAFAIRKQLAGTRPSG